MKIKLILVQICLLCMTMLPVVVQAQFTYTTNADGSLNIYQYTGSGGAVIIPDNTNNLPITSIGDNAFENYTSLTSITIGTNIASIGAWSFYDTSLSDITIPNNVTNIGALAFYGCNSLTNVMISTNLSEIRNGVFLDCPLQRITIPNSVTSIEDNAFESSSLTSLIIPNSVNKIGYSSFSFCSSLTNVMIGTNVSVMGGFVFWGCSQLISVSFPDSVTNIGDNMFEDCYSLTSITIPNSVTSIGELAFSWCSSLTNITIPNSVTNIGDQAFLACTSLGSVYFQGNAPGVFSDSFNYDPATVYYLPDTTGWSDFATNTGVPTALWLPAMQPSDRSFGVGTNQFGFNIQWASDQTVVVEASTNLVDWLQLQTNMLTTGSAYFSDSQWTNYPSRFYRLRSQ